MNKLIASLIFITLAISCQKALKDVNDYFPVVNTISATVQPDGTVLVEGEIESEGDWPSGKLDIRVFCHHRHLQYGEL